jgi:endoglucanase
MTAENFCKLARRLLRHPTAPYHEHAVRAELARICAEHELDSQIDRFGNLLVKLRTVPNLRPLALAAHMDHPGFEIIRQISGRKWLAQFQGGVPANYLRQGTPIILMPDRQPAKIGRTIDGRTKLYELHAEKLTAVAPKFAVWALRDFVVRRGKIQARACDDLIGVVAALAALIELQRTRAQVNVLGVFSRAEEVGFHGALALAANRSLKKNTLVLSLETSRELPGVKMGQGVILRVGDRASIFDSDASRFLAEVAADLKGRKTGFVSQRGLMSGGTCQATAYQEFGFQSAAICIALGNYHNCGEGNRIREEYVSVADACSMVDLLMAAAKSMPRFGQLTAKLPQSLKKLLREAQPKLRRTALTSHAGFGQKT